MKCLIQGKIVECKTIENLGYQNGVYVRAVEYNGKEHIVKKVRGQWVQHVPTIEKAGRYCGQNT